MKQRIYFDNNATTPLDPRVFTTIVSHLETSIGNPSSVHSYGQECKQALNKARRIIAAYFKVKPEQILFHSGATEGLNTLLHSVAEKHPHGHIITSNIEHSAIFQPLKRLSEKGYKVTFLPAGLTGAITERQVEEALTPETSLLLFAAVNNETGVKNPIQKIAKIAHLHSIPFIVDAVAALGRESLQMTFGISAMVLSGHKIHGPKGIGMTILDPQFKYLPLILGGEQELNRRGGTENLPGIVGLSKAIEILAEEGQTASEHMLRLRSYFEECLLKNFPNAKINGVGERTVNVSNVCFEGKDGETLLMALDLQGIAVSHGSACTSGALEPSRILLNMGLSMEQARSSLRFSFSRMNTLEEVNHCLEVLKRI